jgi:hypothetical protein
VAVGEDVGFDDYRFTYDSLCRELAAVDLRKDILDYYTRLGHLRASSGRGLFARGGARSGDAIGRDACDSAGAS